MIIELLSCLGCQRIVDQITMGRGCIKCGSKHFRAVGPTAMVLVRWFLANPKHVIKLLIRDFRGEI